MAELREKYILDQKDIEAAGFDKGLKKGIEQGFQQGEEQPKIKIAKEMLLNGEDIEKIIKYTGLSEEIIKKL